MFSKRSETSGIRGQLYETKLLSLLYFRAIHDDVIEEFQLASNIDKIGAFDDICLKAKLKGHDKPVAVFIQAKHRENDKQTLHNNLVTYFDSYLKIRQTFEPRKDDLLFNDAFDETQCSFVIYTTAKDEFCTDSVQPTSFSSHLNDLIDTGGTAKQPYQHEEDVEFLCQVTLKEQITSLAKRIATFMYDEGNFQLMLTDELVQRYHVVLAKNVVDVSEIQPLQGKNIPRHRIASFRQDFFDTTEEYLLLFKDSLYKEIVKRRTIKPADIRYFLNQIFCSILPIDPRILSKLIGTVITYNNGQLVFDKQSTKDFKPEINPMKVSRSTVNKAVELAAKEILLSRKFRVPTAFGNKDLTISGSDIKVEKRLNHITARIIDLLDKCESTKIVTVDKSLEEGFLQLNGGIAGAIGNIFVLDDSTTLMKITDNWESLEDLAKRLYQKLKLSGAIPNLYEYKFDLKVNKFPKLTFDSSEYDKNLARYFLKNLLFYYSQADENGVEELLKSEIEDYQHGHSNYFQVKTDAIFLKYHDEIQKWWMLPKQASYLTRASDLFQNAINSIIIDPLISSINVTYMSKIKQYDFTFTEDAVTSLNLQDQHSSTVIITENSVLTIVKVLQHLKNKEHAVLDLEYLVNLPTNDRNALRAELTNTNEEKVLIFVCDKLRNSRKENKTLENIAKAVLKKKTIIITDKVSIKILKKYFPSADSIVYDEKSSLIHMNKDSQKTILENARVIFQGIEVKLNLIVDDESMVWVKGDVLHTIVSKETIIAVSKELGNRFYDEIKYLYVDRRVKKAGDDVLVKTLYDIADDIVLVTAEPGMGKSTLLTHLSLKTKETDPSVWIVRINLLEYSREFSKWKEQKTIIDLSETLKFMCRILLREKLGKENYVEIALEEENGVVYLKHCTGDKWTEFELKLFLHFYNEGKMIFLFDGFDEICPHYTKEVIACLNIVSNNPQKPRMWVTSRSYNEVKTILQREFGSSYEIDYFSPVEMDRYLDTFWEFNLKLEELNSAQLENVKNFFEYMLHAKDARLHGFAMPLHTVYINAAHYLVNEIKYTSISLWSYNTKYDDSYYVQSQLDNIVFHFHDDNSDGNPLHLFLAAVFFESNIKSVNRDTNKWNLEINTFTFYERFLETKMKTIRFQEKNEMNIYNPDIIMTYDKEHADFISKHKKLAAYAMFHLHSLKLFSMKDLVEIKEMIRCIEKGGEKTGLIYSIQNEIPIFIHMTFTEYFAVEYVCDCLKNDNSSERQILWMDFIFNVMFSMERLLYARNILDYKIQFDKSLISILEKNKETIFNLIMKQGRLYSEYNVNLYKARPGDLRSVGIHYWALSDALKEQAHNFVLFFVKILGCYINTSNLNEFLDIVKGSRLLLSAQEYKSEVLLIFVLDIVHKIDGSKLTSVLHDNFPFLSHSTISSYAEMSNQKLVAHILAHEDAGPFDFPPPSPRSFTSRPSTPSLHSRPPTPNLHSRPFTPSLHSPASSSSLPERPFSTFLFSWLSTSCRRPSTPSMPRSPPISRLHRQPSTPCLPRWPSASSLPSQRCTSRRRSV